MELAEGMEWRLPFRATRQEESLKFTDSPGQAGAQLKTRLRSREGHAVLSEQKGRSGEG